MASKFANEYHYHLLTHSCFSFCVIKIVNIILIDAEIDYNEDQDKVQIDKEHPSWRGS